MSMTPAENSPQQFSYEHWKNYFRELDHGTSGCGTWLLIGGGALLVLIDLSAQTILLALVGVIMIGIGVWMIIQHRKGSLVEVPQQKFDQRLDGAVYWARRRALERLNLDEQEDVLQDVILLGGTTRPFIPGIRTTLSGMREYGTKHWIPRVPARSGDGSMHYCYGRYWIHVLFALEDSIAFVRTTYDLLDDQWSEHWETNRIYYRHIENVQMEQTRFIIWTVGGRYETFAIFSQDLYDEISRSMSSPQSQVAQRNAVAIPEVDSRMVDAGQYFVNSVNQLRDEWERRQRASG